MGLVWCSVNIALCRSIGVVSEQTVKGTPVEAADFHGSEAIFRSFAKTTRLSSKPRHGRRLRCCWRIQPLLWSEIRSGFCLWRSTWRSPSPLWSAFARTTSPAPASSKPSIWWLFWWTPSAASSTPSILTRRTWGTLWSRSTRNSWKCTFWRWIW